MKTRNIIVAFIVYCGLAFIVYHPILGTPFISDDWHWLYVASERHSIMPDMLANTAGEHSGGSYNPLASLYVNTLYQWFGLNPTPYHAGSIVLHILVACALTVLAAAWMRAFGALELKQDRVGFFSFAAGALFILWPSLVEAVSWVSSVPHLLATLFYLISIIYFLRWKEGKKVAALCISLFSGAAAFFSKESAISLPFLLVILEVGYELFHHRRFLSRQSSVLALYGLLAMGFVSVRYAATGLTLGTYTDESFIFRFKQMVNTFGTFWEEFTSAGLLREEWMRLFLDSPRLWSLALAVVAVLAVILLRRFRNCAVSVACAACCVSIVPYVTLGFSRTTAESERYTYLPLIFFIILLVSLCSTFVCRRKTPLTLLVVCTIVLLIPLGSYARHKVLRWHTAGLLNEQIIDGTRSLMAQHPKVAIWYAVALPDTVDGAHVFRNNLQQALLLRGGGVQKANLVYVPVYLTLTSETAARDNVLWFSDEKGLLGETRDDAYLVTGVDREVMPFVTYELWHYDYTTFTSDTIRLIFTDQVLAQLREGTSAVLTWNKGAVHMIPYEP